MPPSGGRDPIRADGLGWVGGADMSQSGRSGGARLATVLGAFLLAFGALTGVGYLELGDGKGGEAFVMLFVAFGLPALALGALLLWVGRPRRAP